jgi:two-component system CheB/CheR fusion protein
MVTATRLVRADPSHALRYVETLERQSGQMARLLDDLLEASRVTQNKIELRRSVVDLRQVVKDAADAVRPLMEERGVAFEMEVGPRPIHVDGDPARLQQIQVNLLTNAAKYTPRGGHVRLDARRDGGTAIVSVADDGAGIPAEMLDSIFDLFVQSARTLDRSDGGLGVGLTLVRSLVAMHGGEVKASSAGPGKGSEFVVTLPVSDAAPIPDHVDGLALPPRRGRGGSEANVVVVEDNDDSRQMLCTFLEQAGFACRSARTGTAGLELIEEVHPAVALIDVGLPEMNGLEVARRLRSDPKNEGIYLVALTGYGQPSDRAAANEAGFDGHLVKPVDPDYLVQWLAKATGAAHA